MSGHQENRSLIKGPVDSSRDGLDGGFRRCRWWRPKQHRPTQVAVSTSASSTSPVQPDDSKRSKQLSQKHNSWNSFSKNSWQQGLPDLEALREASCLPQTEVSGESSELRDLRRQVDQLRQERDAWMSTSGAHGRFGNTIRRSTLMLGLIEAGNAKRRCVNPSAMPSSLANSVP